LPLDDGEFANREFANVTKQINAMYVAVIRESVHRSEPVQ